ncbi:hypothetical protein H0H93_003650 [Arthromyces matolae]|nr:hypothetical protein H0H93_003650 [Arthromyces matolae]
MSFWLFKRRPRRASPSSISSVPTEPTQRLEASVVTHVELPPEMWVLILEHIDIGPNLSVMRGVNCAFRSLALDREYREVDFVRKQEKHILKHVQLFRDRPYFASRVRTLKLDSHASRSAIAAPIPSQKKRRNGFDHMFSHPEFYSPLDDSSLLYAVSPLRVLAMRHSARNLLNVRDLHYTMNYFEDPCPIFKSLLPLISPNLQTLSLDWRYCAKQNSDDPPAVLMKWETDNFHRVQMPNLQSLTIVLVARLRKFDKDFESFIESVPSTLHSLSIEFSRHKDVQWSFLPNNLAATFRKFTELDMFSVALPMCLDSNDQILDPTPLKQFLLTNNSAS